MTYFAIKHLPTGGFLPEFGSRKGRGGYTHDEPVTHFPPRLFTRKQDAKVALGHWLKGKVTVRTYQDYEGEWDESWHIEPCPDRRPEEMKIVEMQLIEVNP